jgi:tetratricopeptide (TPR) repeat protein
MSDAALVSRLAAGETLPEACVHEPDAARETLGWAIKAACHDAWSSDPARVPVLAAALAALAQRAPTALLQALAAWTDGLAQIVHGRMEPAVAALDTAHTRWIDLGRRAEAAQTQVPKLIALAVLGRHDEALACAESALATFVSEGDERSAGKIELNLASMLLRQERYADAAPHYRAAAVRFARLGDTEHSVMADIGLATTLSWQFRFDDAAWMLERARMRADTHGLPVLAALARGSLGQLELHRGAHQRALHELEASARALAGGASPQRHAEAERALADAYLALNLWPEAQALLERVVETAQAMQAPVEQARAEVDLAQALARQGDAAAAAIHLAAGRLRFLDQGNAVGAALADLREAAMVGALGDGAAALPLAERAQSVFAGAGVLGWQLEAQRIAAAALLRQGRIDDARTRLVALCGRAWSAGLPTVLAAGETLLGDAAEREGRPVIAQAHYEAAAELYERQRRALPGDDLRTEFGVDKQAPFDGLVRLAAADAANPAGAAALLRAIERGRARSLGLEGGRRRAGAALPQADTAVRDLRTRLNWTYHQWHRALAGEDDPARAADLERGARAIERELIERERRGRWAASTAAEEDPDEAELDVAALQAALPADAALVEVHLDGDRWHAVVVRARGVNAVHGDAGALAGLLDQARFQIDAMRFGARSLAAHGPMLVARARHRLQALYRLVFEPLEASLQGCRRLILVPHRQLHYVPWAALHDGAQWLVERFDLSLAPSAAFWHAAQARAVDPPQRAVLFGHGPGLPQVARELAAIAGAWGARAQAWLGDDATVGAVQRVAPQADWLHLACHARFRADNPAFSSLVLADGALTMLDAARLPLHAALVSLSACETAVARIAPGDELVGLVRGFLLAGAASVVASLWTVEDAATADLMAAFARRLHDGDGPTAALCGAQREAMTVHPHPGAWAAFAVHGRG